MLLKAVPKLARNAGALRFQPTWEAELVVCRGQRNRAETIVRELCKESGQAAYCKSGGKHSSERFSIQVGRAEAENMVSVSKLLSFEMFLEPFLAI